MKQLDLFGLVDAETISFRIYYKDPEGVCRWTEPLSATKSTIYTAINAWCDEHKENRFLYYRSNKSRED